MPRPEKIRLGEILVLQKLLSQEQLTFSLEEQKRTGRKLGRVFVENGFVTEEDISGALARQFAIPYINLKHYNVDAEAARQLPESQARRFRALVLENRNTGSLLVGMADPADLFAYDEISRLLKKEIDLAVVNEGALLQAIDRIYRRTEEITDLARELEQELGDSVVDFGAMGIAPGLEEAPVVKLLQSLFDDAVQVHASDIHIEPQELRLQIRFRIDGVLHLQTEADMNNAPANQVYLSIVTGTRYSMLVHPDVRGNVSVNLKSVTVFEALEALRELYGFNYQVDGTRIFIQPLTMQSRVFQVNYLSAIRKGSSDMRVVSGSVSDAPRTATPGVGAPTTTSSGSSEAIQSTRISTSSDSNFWGELAAAVRTIVGTEEGRSVVISPQSGVLVVRALPNELRTVEQYLRATQLSVDRQVIIEAKIIEVELNDNFQAGINWAAFANGRNRLSVGSAAPGTILQTGGTLATGVSAIDYAARTFAGPKLSSLPGQDLITDPSLLGGLFGLAFQASNFAALISFLETQGGVQVLSSPRIATLNNQKAVLKVGTDDFFVTNVSSTTTTGTATTTTPNVTLQPFFSGIVLDVTPQIDENDNITLHIHPSVSNVVTKDTVINLGGAGGALNLPLASSTVSETDSMVRAQDGQVVAIGGLMKSASTSDRSQVPVAGEIPVVGNLFKQTNRSSVKKELVILLKPTIVRGGDWGEDILRSRDRIQAMQRGASHGAQGQ